jgi:hypothetical protein
LGKDKSRFVGANEKRRAIQVVKPGRLAALGLHRL